MPAFWRGLTEIAARLGGDTVKRALTLVVFLGFGLCPAPYLAMHLSAAGNDAQKAVAELESKWAAAQKVGDASVVAPMLADDFVNTDADGESYGKEKLLSNLKGGEWEQNGISDVNVTVYGNTAIATGAWAGKGVDGDGTKIDRSERWTDTWVKMPGGRWQCVASQQTRRGKSSDSKSGDHSTVSKPLPRRPSNAVQTQ
jgi:ketosteroid isomerase-like protein